MKKNKRTKQDIIMETARKAHIPQAKGALFVNAVLDEISKALLKGKRVEIRGFGVFKAKKYKAYTGRNPLNQAKIRVKAKVRPRFKPGAVLRALVKGGKKP